MKKHKKTKKHKSTFNDFYADAPRDPDIGCFALTDTGNSWRLIERVGGVIRFNTDGQYWQMWDNTRWNKQRGDEFVKQSTERTVMGISEEASHDSVAFKKRILNWCKQSQSKRSRDALRLIASSNKCLVVHDDDLDRDIWMLNCLSGTINLRTGEMHDHDPAELITKLCPVEYGGFDFDEEDIPEARLWHKFLKDATGGDKEYERFLQTAIGYSATGSIKEEKMFFVYGATASGKSTFLEAIKSVLGDYAAAADFETFLKRRDVGGTRPDIAHISGARMVTAIEVDEGKRLSEGLVKTITGGDTVSARHLYRDYFEYKPKLKLWLAANTAPRISDKDSAMWRRIVRLPFEHTVPKHKINPDVKQRLCSKGAGAVILSWIVSGALRYQKEGLKLPTAVQQSTKQYQKEMNPLKGFFEECCIFNIKAVIKRSVLYRRYTNYCERNKIRYQLSQIKFNERLETRHCTKTKKYIDGAQTKVWIGVKVSK